MAESLKSWSKKSLGNLGRQIKETRALLNSYLNSEDQALDQSRIHSIEGRLEKLLYKEEVHWKQRSRVNWLNSGDRNTTFFHKMASERKKKNYIGSIRNDEGIPQTDQKSIEVTIQKYYDNLFKSQNPSAEDIEKITRCINPSVTGEMNRFLIKPFTSEEVRKALFDLNPSKAPGPDGFSALFFQNAWHEIGEDIVLNCLRILNEDQGLSNQNPTNITLIPKIKNPRSLKDFRPISLCNVSYKIVARAITNRLRIVMGSLIDPNQSAFIPGRLISDNIILGFECMHWLRHNKNKQGFASLKLDMSKAYDRVEWVYLEKVMHKMGFDTNWIKLIMECVTTPTYSFRVNNNLSGKVTPSRGLRQGDPLSPFLFVIVAQGLSSIITTKAAEGSITGIRIARGSPVITHLFFADDSLIFFKANKEETRTVKNCLKDYEKASGQLINFDKSAITFSKSTPQTNIDMVKACLHIQICHGHDLYLGLPTFSIHSKRLQFGYLRDKVAKQLGCWRNKFFTDGGREILLKSVIQAIPTYAMSCFRIPTSICGEIESLCARFWWGGNVDEKKIYWKDWKELTRPKKEGGMGFRDLVTFNRALLAKQIWRIILYPDSLVAKVLKARYFRHTYIMEATIGSNPSYIWRSIMWSKSII